MEKLCVIACMKNASLRPIMESALIDKNEMINKNCETNVEEFKTAINRKKKDRPWKKPVENATVRCTSASQTDKVFILDDEGKVFIGDLSVLTRENIMLSRSFRHCQYSFDQKCPNEREIEGNEWKDCDEMNKQGQDNEELDKEKSYMVCLTGHGIIYFVDSGQTIKDFAEDFATLNRYVNKNIFEKMGWNVEDFKAAYGADVIEKLKEYMYQYGITDRYSICMFLATLGTESGDGTMLLEGRTDFSTVTYEPHTRGAGLIQLTGLDQKMFFEYLLAENPNRKDSGILLNMKNGFKTTQKIINGKSRDNCDNQLDSAKFIANNYAIESAVWYWASYNKCTYDMGNGSQVMSLNQYVSTITEKEEQQKIDYKNVFLVSQYYVNGSAWKLSRLQKIAECADGTYNIGNNNLTFTLPQDDPDAGFYSKPLPNGWQERAEDWQVMEYELFG